MYVWIYESNRFQKKAGHESTKHHNNFNWISIYFRSNDMEMVSFESTPSMSSYLVAIFVGEFVSNKNNSFITVYSHKNNINRTEYVRIEALKHLQALEEYTGIKYMLPKLDMLAIPNDFFVGMENWGITIYEWAIDEEQ